MDIGGSLYLRMAVTEFLDPGAVSAAFEAPDTLRLIDRREAIADAPAGADEPPLVFEAVAADLYRVPDVRGGFAPLVMTFADFSVVIDAPAGYPLLAELPPGHTDPAPSMSHHSERLVDAIAERFPDRPLRYVVLTHAHLDHVGGVRAFVDAGATVLGAPTTQPVVEALVQRTDIRPDRLSASLNPLVWEDVTDVREITDGSRTLRVLSMGDNPHDPGMLVVHVPASGVMFVSDMITPCDSLERVEI